MIRLKAERLRRGWSQQTLAYHAGMQGADICRMETGILRPYPGQAQRLGAVLGLLPEELLEEVSVEQLEASHA